MTMTITLADFDRAVATSRRNIEELTAEKVAAEAAALAAMAAQFQQSEAEKARVNAERRRLQAIADFEIGPLATATAKFAEMHQRAARLTDLGRQAESLHAEIVAGALALQRDANDLTQSLVDALPYPSEESANDAMTAAGAAGLDYRMPGWLQSLNSRRWMAAPSVSEFVLFQLATGLASERQRK